VKNSASNKGHLTLDVMAMKHFVNKVLYVRVIHIESNHPTTPRVHPTQKVTLQCDSTRETHNGNRLLELVFHNMHWKIITAKMEVLR